MLYRLCRLLLILEVTTLSIQLLLPTCLQLCNPPSIKLDKRPSVRGGSVLHYWMISHEDSCPRSGRGSYQMLQDKVSEKNVIRSPNQVALCYSWQRTWHSVWRCHVGRVHICLLPVMVPFVSIPVAHLSIAARAGSQWPFGPSLAAHSQPPG